MASFRKKPNDKWEYRVSYLDKQTGKYKLKSKGGFKTKKEAQIAAAKVEEDMNYFGFSEDGEENVKTYFDQWLEVFKKPNVKPITYTLQEQNVRLNIIPRWGNYRLKDINRLEYQKWINELRDHYSEGTVRRIHSIMNTAIFDAINEFQIMKMNPIQKISIPKETNKNDEIFYFTVEQLEVFLNETQVKVKNAKYKLSNQYYNLFLLMARTGIRVGEALALTWEDIDFEEQMLNVNKTLVYPLNSTPYISTPKSKASLRKIKLDEKTMKVMKSHRTNRKEVCLAYSNYESPKEENLVFFQHDGRWLRTNVVRDYFKTICKRANLPILSPHALRHTHAIHLLEAGANLKYVSARLGHSSVKITADTYLHVTKKIEDSALDLYQSYVK
ncbi:recombinase XerC [Paenibacillus sp. FSL H7-0326]|uniref:site-specific integrase n=1 Tax=Paenibacillus sp. FSL H7-0326 TaxID=1921144 RepID=UPI00096C61B3|nr:site-specific integrase [Paenibacillus sp. FSL H7-0326]OMC71512.1 recombinase XerC [Paenibacillus sp. FSL H7-0326]